MLAGLSAASFILSLGALIAFAATESLFWLRMSYWLSEGGLVTGAGAALIGAASWFYAIGGPAVRADIWLTARDLLVLTLFSVAWLGLGGLNGAPATTNRDITVPMVAAFAGLALLLAVEASLVYESRRQRRRYA